MLNRFSLKTRRDCLGKQNDEESNPVFNKSVPQHAPQIYTFPCKSMQNDFWIQMAKGKTFNIIQLTETYKLISACTLDPRMINDANVAFCHCKSRFIKFNCELKIDFNRFSITIDRLSAGINLNKSRNSSRRKHENQLIFPASDLHVQGRHILCSYFHCFQFHRINIHIDKLTAKNVPQQP